MEKGHSGRIQGKGRWWFFREAIESFGWVFKKLSEKGG